MRSLTKIPPFLVTLVVSLAVWQWAVVWGPMQGSSIPPALDTLRELGYLLTLPATWIGIGQTIQVAGVGFLIAIVTAIPTGILVGLSPHAYQSTKFTFDFLRVIPPIVIIPIVLLLLGPTIEMGIFLVFFATFFMLAMQTAYGIRDTDPILLDTMRCYGLTRYQQIVYARLPSALPFVSLGVRITVTAAMIVAVVAGLIGGAPGLGKDLLLAQASGAATVTFSIVLILGILGLVLSKGVQILQRRLVFWVPQ
jgi:ABC-type nitrate/sulfonate/bicarbonate transport system permease component